MPHEKDHLYHQLTAECRACRRCSELRTPQGCVHPSTWAMWLGNRDAKVVVVGQDPAGSDNVNPADPTSYAPGPFVGTNLTLSALIAAAGIDQAQVYLTNAILCIKPGAMGSEVCGRWATNCRPFLRRTIDIVSPVAVVGLGAVAWNSVCRAYGVPSLPLRRVIGRTPIRPSEGPRLVPMFHPGRLGQASRSLAVQTQDWRAFGRWLRAQAH